jgi:hypothetical protein
MYTKTKRFREFRYGFLRTHKKNGTITTTTRYTQTTKGPNTVTLGENPQWRAQIARGQNATTYLDGKLYELVEFRTADYRYTHPSPGTLGPTAIIEYEGKYFPLSILGNPGGGFDAWDASLETKCDNRAKVGILRKIQRSIRPFQGAVFLGELREAISMIKRPGQGLRKVLDKQSTRARKLRARSLRRRKGGKRSTLPEVHRDLADQYLEYSFGWSPLINDLEDGMAAASKILHRRYGTSVSFEAKESKITTKSNAGWENIASNIRVYRFILERQDVSTRYFVRLTRDFDTNAPPFVRGALGLTLRDFAPAAWELLPWSFLIDYFTNVGDVINGLSHGRSGVAWAYKTRRRSRTVLEDWTLSNRSNYLTQIERPGKLVYTNSEVNRNTYGGGFTPSISFDIPSSPWKWLNIGALAVARKRDGKYSYWK